MKLKVPLGFLRAAAIAAYRTSGFEPAGESDAAKKGTSFFLFSFFRGALA